MRRVVRIAALPESLAAAQRLAARLGVGCEAIDVHRFPDGELRVRVGEVAPTMLVYASLDHPNDKLIALLLASEALRRGGAWYQVLIAPYLCYMRQDKAFHSGEAISQRVIGPLIASAVDRVITVDAHLHRTREIGRVFEGIVAQNLSAAPAIAKALEAGIDPRTVVIGPDSESLPWVRDLATRLGCDHAVADKTRSGDRYVEVRFAEPARFAGRPALLVDDIVSSGGTLIACAQQLTAAGATRIDAVITHALFPAEMGDAFKAAGIATLRSTDSVTHPSNAIALDELFAAALGPDFTTTGPSR